MLSNLKRIYQQHFQKPSRIFKFSEPENTACFTCDHVMNRDLPILMVAHNTDGCWEFMCGGLGHSEANIKIISLLQATEIDPSVNDLYEMPIGVGAERETIKDKWIPVRLPTDNFES